MADEFWCKVFLAAIPQVFQACAFTGAKEGHVVAQCADLADAALVVARERGMVTGERPASADEAPELERVEFKVAPDELKPGWWRVLVPDVGVFVVQPGEERRQNTVAAIRIKWGETMPPKPIEVWLERPAVEPP